MRQLHALRASFSAGQRKVELIVHVLRRPPRRLAEVNRLHDALLFLRAFPDSEAVLRAAESACLEFQRIARGLAGARRRAEDTGMIGTITRDAFGYPLTVWLHRYFPEEVDIDWREVTDDSVIDELLRPALHRAEEDAFESGALSTREWLALRRGTSPISDLGLLLRAAPKNRRGRRTFATLYESAEVPLRWRLDNSTGSSTHNTLATRGTVYRRAMRSAPSDPVRFIASPTRAIELLPRDRAREVIHVARAALASRGREVHAISYANPSEVYLADLGEGGSVAILGVVPEGRVSLESNFGYLILSNGVPIGYGGVTPLYRQNNTGLNIFPSFRGGETAYLWAATLRAFHSLFGVRRFVVNRYQVGEGNREALESGAFWLYFRLGFRPADPVTRGLANREFARVRDHRARSSEATLRKLAKGDLWLTLPGFRRADYFDEAWLVECSRRATRLLSAETGMTPGEAARAVSERVAMQLGVRRITSWPAAERAAFEDLAPVCALLPDLRRWNAASRSAIVRLMRAKGKLRELEFVLLARDHPRFFPGLIGRLAAPTKRTESR